MGVLHVSWLAVLSIHNLFLPNNPFRWYSMGSIYCKSMWMSEHGSQANEVKPPKFWHKSEADEAKFGGRDQKSFT
jgi:hypothetical protein